VHPGGLQAGNERKARERRSSWIRQSVRTFVVASADPSPPPLSRHSQRPAPVLQPKARAPSPDFCWSGAATPRSTLETPVCRSCRRASTSKARSGAPRTFTGKPSRSGLVVTRQPACPVHYHVADHFAEDLARETPLRTADPPEAAPLRAPDANDRAGAARRLDGKR
jgi:hypothetical protein